MWWEWCGKNTYFLLNDAMFATFFFDYSQRSALRTTGFFHAQPPGPVAPCAPPPPCPPLLFSMSSLIAVGVAMAVIGRGSIVDSAQGAGRPLLLCYLLFCYF